MLSLKFDAVTGEMRGVSIECKIGISDQSNVEYWFRHQN